MGGAETSDEVHTIGRVARLLGDDNSSIFRNIQVGRYTLHTRQSAVPTPNPNTNTCSYDTSSSYSVLVCSTCTNTELEMRLLSRFQPLRLDPLTFAYFYLRYCKVLASVCLRNSTFSALPRGGEGKGEGRPATADAQGRTKVVLPSAKHTRLRQKTRRNPSTNAARMHILL